MSMSMKGTVIISQDAEAFVIKVNDTKYSVFIGKIDGLINNVFAFRGTTIPTTGSIITNKVGTCFMGSEDGARCRRISDKMDETEVLITNLICALLSRGFIIKDVIDILKSTGGRNKKFCTVLVKTLSKFLVSGEKQ